MDDFDSFMDGIAPKPKSGLVAEAFQIINSDDDASYVDCSSEDEISPVRKPPQKTQSRDLEKMMYGGDIKIMSPTVRARAMQARERAKRAEEMKKKHFFASRLRRGTIQGILAACEAEEAATFEKDEAKCKPEIKCAPVGTLTRGKPTSVSSSSKKTTQNLEDPTSDKPKKKKAEDPHTFDRPKQKKNKKNVEDPASDEPKKKQGAKGELRTSQLGNSLPKADPTLAPPTETSQSLPVSPIKRVNRLSAVDANEEKIVIDPNEENIFIELDAETLSALLSLLQVDEQSMYTRQSERSESRQSQRTIQSLASKRKKRTPNTLSPTPLSPKPQYLSPRPYRRSSIGNDTPRSERSTESQRYRRELSESRHSPPRGSLYKREVDEEVILPKPSSIGNDSTRSGRSTESRRSRRDLSESRHQRNVSPPRCSSSHTRTRSASNPRGELSESRHRREKSPRRCSSSHARTRGASNPRELSESRYRGEISPRRSSSSHARTRRLIINLHT